MSKFIAWCIEFRFLVIFGVLLAGVLGVRTAKHLPIDAVPDVTNVQVQVLTNAPALGPVEIEQYVTSPIERVMSGLPQLEQVRSLSRVGLSAVTIVFEEGTDIYFARQLVSERLTEARQKVPVRYGNPELGPISTGLGEIYQFEVRGSPACPKGGEDTPDCYTPMELRTLLDWTVVPQLKPLKGVVAVNAFGGELKTYEVEVDPGRLGALGLSLHEVFEALEANNANEGGGYITQSGEQRVIRGEALVQSLEDIRSVRVATRKDGKPLFIRDVGEVKLAPMIRQGAVTRDGRGEVVTGTVMMLMGENSGAVAKRVRERLDELGGSMPKGVKLETYYDRSELVDRTIRTVVINLIEGGILVIVVLLLLLGNLRGGLLIAAVIPLSLLITFMVMRVLGVSGNLMSLGALDFGLIIDGAIVMIENIIRRLGQSGAKGEREVKLEVREAAVQVMKPVLFGGAIIMIVYLPILSLQGIEGKMFRPMAIVVLAALAAAMTLAVVMVPAVSTWLYVGGVSPRETWLSRVSHAMYEPLLQRALHWRWGVIAMAVALTGLGAWLATGMGAQFIPKLDEGTIAMQAIRPPSVALEESVVATTRVEQVILEKFGAEVKSVISRTGRAEIATDPMGVDLSDIYIMLHPKSQWKRVKSKGELVEAIERELMLQVPGQNYMFSQPIELRTNELISGSRAEVAVSIYGDDFDQLQRAGQKVAAALQKVEGAAEVNLDQVAGLPSLRVKVDRQAAARYGIHASEVLDAVAAIGGRSVGTVFEGQKRFVLQVRLHPEARQNREVLQHLLISAPDGRQVPLGQIASLIEDEVPSVVSRSQAQRRVTVQMSVRERALDEFVADAKAKVRGVKLPAGYVVEWGGNFKNLEEASEQLALAVPVALLLIFMLLYTTFGSIRPALIIYLNVPVAAVGGVFALWIRGMPLSISAGVGFIALSGIAVLNGVVMVTMIRELQRDGATLFDATKEGATLRLRAILMTALTDGVGFLPMAITTSAGGGVQRPLATVVIGGLITATWLTLFVLPAVYSKFGEELQQG